MEDLGGVVLKPDKDGETQDHDDGAEHVYSNLEELAAGFLCTVVEPRREVSGSEDEEDAAELAEELGPVGDAVRRFFKLRIILPVLAIDGRERVVDGSEEESPRPPSVSCTAELG
jgi:hypothetical protein